MPLTDEIEIEMEGEWETNSHGTQYKVETFLEVVPRTREGILGYLSCGSLKELVPKRQNGLSIVLVWIPWR